MKITNIFGRQVSFRHQKYVIDWDGKSKSKLQFTVKQFFKYFWSTDLVLEELTIPSSLLKKVPFAKSANLGVIVQNAWLIWANTKKYGIDPSELETFYREGGQLSSTRQYGLNLRVSF